MKHFEKEKQVKRLRISKLITTLIGVSILIFGIVQIVVANKSASSGENVKRLEEESEKLQEENEKLEIEIAKAASLVTIEEKSKKLGFIKPTSIVFLTTPLPVALNKK